MELINQWLPLTGLVLCVGAVVLTLLLMGVAAWLLPRRVLRKGRMGATDVLAQVGVMLLVTVLALASVGLWINRTFAMYTTWDDLILGAGEARTVTAVGGDNGNASGPSTNGTADLQRATTAAVPASLKDPRGDRALPGVKDTRDGQWIRTTLKGTASDVTSEVAIHLPAGYLQNPEKRYPVILAFSGIPGSPQSFENAFHLGTQLDDRAAQGTLASAIIVAPAVYPGQYDTECVDSSSDAAAHGSGGTSGKKKQKQQGTQWETWIAEDVVGFAKKHLRTIEDPQAWTTFGYSAGGWCASMISVKHPDIARTSLSMAGYFQVQYTKGQEWTALDDPRYDLPRIVRETKPPVTMYLFAGEDDVLPRASLKRMQEAVASDPESRSALTAQMTPRGGHAMLVWIEHAPTVFDWLNENVPAFAGSKTSQGTAAAGGGSGS